MTNMCSYRVSQNIRTDSKNNVNARSTSLEDNNVNVSKGKNDYASNITNNDLFCINGDRLELFGISINIDDLIILIMLFFLFRENNIDYSIIIILALILFDQS